ncbi:MAG TPA: vitamin K epoxide reductase family protein [Fimbriimonas sp.]|nr:vitamin K epoxide reductase family protein [Fimbriimonas sp.]
MKALLYNRVLLVLGFIGLFIAGVLSLAKIMDKIPPCGGSHGCDAVTNSPSSFFLGVPIAYIGFGAYVVLTGMAFLRARSDPARYRLLSLLGFMVAAIGTLISIGLQLYSFFVIRDICPWCLSSAVCMTITVIVYALMYQELLDIKPEEMRGALSKSNLDVLLTPVLSVVLLLALSAEGLAIRNGDRVPARPVDLALLKKAKLQLIPDNPKYFGNLNAPVKILEFADLNCPSCQQYSPLVKEFVRQHPNNLCVIFRHFPLPMHKTSELAAAMAEYAFEKGKFWDFTLAVMAEKKEIDDPNELFAIANQVNLDTTDMKKRLENVGNDPISQRVTADKNVGNALGVSQTPTFIVIAQGQTPKAYGAASMMEALRVPPLSKLINGS